MTEKESAKILTAAELMSSTPPWRDVHCVAWRGTVRIARLSGPDKLRMAIAASQLARNEQGSVTLTEPENWCFAIDLLAACIIGDDGSLQFAEPSAKDWLSGEINAVAELLTAAMEINGLGAAEQDAEIEAAKKD